MKKVNTFLGITLLFVSLIPLSTAQQDDKSKFCPALNQIKINLTTQWHYVLSAYNADEKYFVSDEQRYDDHNGPALPVIFNYSTYEPAEKKLSCVYYAYHLYNIHPTLVNIGDY